MSAMTPRNSLIERLRFHPSLKSGLQRFSSKPGTHLWSRRYASGVLEPLLTPARLWSLGAGLLILGLLSWWFRVGDALMQNQPFVWPAGICHIHFISQLC